MKLKLRLGADPELFLCDAAGDYISAHDLLPGTKANPHWVEKGAIQVDGVAAEFNIEPAGTKKQFKENIKAVLKQMSILTGPNVYLAFDPVASFPPKYFNDLPEETKVLGCMPDWNAYTKRMNSPPERLTDSAGNLMHTAAGHVHISWCKDVNPVSATHLNNCYKLAKQLDYIHLPGTLKFAQGDCLQGELERREMYAAGSFRPKPYGMEYRSISNQWVKYEESIDWIFDATIKGVQLLLRKESVVEPFRQLKLIRNLSESNEYYINSMFKTYDIPELPTKLTEIQYNGS